jgi:hypothetical protein
MGSFRLQRSERPLPSLRAIAAAAIAPLPHVRHLRLRRAR